ncbi:proteasome regulatory particle lid subunit RPN12 [Rhodotorula paludigena]|uniref:proteasome regulatory particle lid subunit RPN12 n=1 Tax=Rhodotorula paludigena TaxID=86838 RepID=UPI0031718921
MGNPEATHLYSDLKHLWAQGPDTNHQRIRDTLAQLKIELSELGLLFPDASSLDKGALTTAREVLEIGALFSIRTDDIPSFERYLSLLSSYYHDLAASLPKSANEAPLVALSLLRLLSQNRIAEFHTALETLEGKDVLDSSEVAWVMQLERSLMEGSYSRVWSLCRPSPSSSSSSSSSSLPLAEFAHFTPTLLATVRAEIAACDERAYESLPLRDAKTLLFFDADDDVRRFAQERNWYLDPSTQLLHFPSSPLHPSRRASSSAAAQGVPATLATGSGTGDELDARELDRSKVVVATLGYARELESIV